MSTMGASTTCSCCSGHSGYHMRGSPLRRSMSDGLLLVLCILPFRYSSVPGVDYIPCICPVDREACNRFQICFD
jgi:hypothetical protein